MLRPAVGRARFFQASVLLLQGQQSRIQVSCNQRCVTTGVESGLRVNNEQADTSALEPRAELFQFVLDLRLPLLTIVAYRKQRNIRVAICK